MDAIFNCHERQLAVYTCTTVIVCRASNQRACRIVNAAEERIRQRTARSRRAFEVNYICIASHQGHRKPVFIPIKLNLSDR